MVRLLVQVGRCPAQRPIFSYQAPPPPPPPPPPENPPPPNPELLPELGGTYEIALEMLVFIDCKLLASNAA